MRSGGRWMVEELLEGEPLPLETCCSSIVKCDMNKTREEKKGESREGGEGSGGAAQDKGR